MRTIETLERRQLLAWSTYATLIGQDALATSQPNLRGQGQVVAVIDTGIDYTHPVLGGGIGRDKKIIAAYDFIQGDSDPQDSDGHGTSVTSFIAGEEFTFEGTTYRGIAPDAKIIALRTGTGRNTYTDALIGQAIDWVVNNRDRYGITILNMSLGGGAYTEYTLSTWAAQFAKLKQMGVFVVVASGNGGVDPNTGFPIPQNSVADPAVDPSVFSVGSVNPRDEVSPFTQRTSILDLMAPGEEVIGALRYTGSYEQTQGTSFATPITAGAVALIKQSAPSLSVDEISSILRTSSVQVRDGDDETEKDFFGNPIATTRVYSRLDLPAAINLAVARANANYIDVIPTTKHTTIDTAYDQNNILHLAYYEPSTRRLMYSLQNSAGKWLEPVSVDTSGAEVGQHLSLAIDQTGRPAIAYYDATNADLKYATLSGGLTWSTSVIDASKSTGQFPSLVFNGVNEPRVAYHSKSTGRLRYAAFNSGNGLWSSSTIDGSSSSVGLYTSLADSGNGRFAVAYADQANGDLKYATQTNTGWATALVDNLQGVGSIELSFNPVGPIIAYQDQHNADVKYAWIRDTQWRPVTVASAGRVGKNIKTYTDADGKFHVVYYNVTKQGTYDAQVRTRRTELIVESTDRVGTVGQTASVAVSARDRSITLVGLNRSAKQMYATNIVDAANFIELAQELEA